jgi:FlaG/FlaF family flagellin (archaellin)
MKISRYNRALSTVISEMLILAIVVILAAAFAVSIQSNISYYVKNKELASIFLTTSTKDQMINFTAFHSGGDPVTITGHIYMEYPNGSTSPLNPILTCKNQSEVKNGEFTLSVKFGDQFQVNINSTELDQGLICYRLSSKTQILAEVTYTIEP